MRANPWRRLLSRRLVRVGAPLAAIAAALALIVTTLRPAPDDASRQAEPTRTLVIDEARVAEDAGAHRLIVRGHTDLVDGAELSVAVLAAGREVERAPVVVRSGAFRLDLPARGAIVEGRYAAQASFRLEEQTQAVREALGHRPASLLAQAPLVLPPLVARATDLREELRALFHEANQCPRDPAVLDGLDGRARALEARLWLAEQKAALRNLRLAVEEARRPEVRRPIFERLLLEGYTLAGL